MKENNANGGSVSFLQHCKQQIWLANTMVSSEADEWRQKGLTLGKTQRVSVFDYFNQFFKNKDLVCFDENKLFVSFCHGSEPLIWTFLEINRVNSDLTDPFFVSTFPKTLYFCRFVWVLFSHIVVFTVKIKWKEMYYCLNPRQGWCLLWGALVRRLEPVHRRNTGTQTFTSFSFKCFNISDPHACVLQRLRECERRSRWTLFGGWIILQATSGAPHGTADCSKTSRWAHGRGHLQWVRSRVYSQIKHHHKWL